MNGHDMFNWNDIPGISALVRETRQPPLRPWTNEPFVPFIWDQEEPLDIANYMAALSEMKIETRTTAQRPISKALATAQGPISKTRTTAQRPISKTRTTAQRPISQIQPPKNKKKKQKVNNHQHKHQLLLTDQQLDIASNIAESTSPIARFLATHKDFIAIPTPRQDHPGGDSKSLSVLKNSSKPSSATGHALKPWYRSEVAPKLPHKRDTVLKPTSVLRIAPKPSPLLSATPKQPFHQGSLLKPQSYCSPPLLSVLKPDISQLDPFVSVVTPVPKKDAMPRGRRPKKTTQPLLPGMVLIKGSELYHLMLTTNSNNSNQANIIHPLSISLQPNTDPCNVYVPPLATSSSQTNQLVGRHFICTGLTMGLQQVQESIEPVDNLPLQLEESSAMVECDNTVSAVNVEGHCAVVVGGQC